MTRPALAALFLALAVPLVLHLLTRSRPRRLPWATWRFLKRPDPADQRIIRLDQPMLLALRTIAIAVLAAAAIGPTCSGSPLQDAELYDLQKPVFVVDLSAGMAIGNAGQRPLDRAASLLDRLWRTYRWTDGEVLGCRGDDSIKIHSAADPIPRRFIGVIREHHGLGGADISACLAGLIGDYSDRDLVVVSDLEPPTSMAGSGFRSSRWYGAGGNPAVANVGFGAIDVTPAGDLVRISGTVQGNPNATVRLGWHAPPRPPAEIVAVDGRFQFELLAPREEGRLILELPETDGAPWDNIAPVWIPRSNRPEVHLRGNWPPRAEKRILDLLYAASDRVKLVSVQGESTPGTDRSAYIVYYPERLAADQLSEIRTAVESGGTVIAFPMSSQQAPVPNPFWVPGWLHPAQIVPGSEVHATADLDSTWPQLADLDWSTVQVRKVLPLADPMPAVINLIETDRGLPVLTRLPFGRGEIYTWMIEPSAAFSNLPMTSNWAPMWLAMLGVLDGGNSRAALLDSNWNPGAELNGGRRVGTAWLGETPGAWLGWVEGTSPAGDRVLNAYRVPAGEVSPGTFDRLIVQNAADGGTGTPPVSREPVDTHLLWVFLAVWLVQAAFSQRRLTAAVFLFGLAIPAPAAAEQPIPLRAWVPAESGATAAQLEGARWAIRQWGKRASPEVAEELPEFSWAVTTPGDPWVWWLGCRPLTPEADRRLGAQLETFVRSHGTLWLGVCGGPVEVRRQAARIQAWAEERGLGAGWRKLDNQHVIFRSFYLLDQWLSPDGAEQVYGLEVEGQDRIILFPNISRSFSREPLGGWVLDLSSQGREIQLRQGLNLLLYTTTYDYKNDSIHLPFILERRRRHR